MTTWTLKIMKSPAITVILNELCKNHGTLLQYEIKRKRTQYRMGKHIDYILRPIEEKTICLRIASPVVSSRSSRIRR